MSSDIKCSAKLLEDLNWKLSFLIRNQGWSEQRKNIYWLHENGLKNKQIAEIINKKVKYIAKELSLYKKELKSEVENANNDM